jgi:hypothetical protein
MSETTPPKDSPADQEAGLFIGSSAKAQELFAEAKRVRRLADRKAWWNQNRPQPSAAERERPIGNLEE